MQNAYVKRPSDKLEVTVDLTKFVANVVGQGIAPEDVLYVVRNEPGITVVSTPAVSGRVALAITGGAVGRVYQCGVEASTTDGDSQIEMFRVRVRDPSLFDTLPAGPGELPSNTYVEPDYVLDDYVV
jgi:hypothetical protein